MLTIEAPRESSRPEFERKSSNFRPTPLKFELLKQKLVKIGNEIVLRMLTNCRHAEA